VHEELPDDSDPSTAELVLLGAPVELRDGSRVRLRQGHSADRELLLRGFERLSPESRYRRFLAAMPHLSEGMVEYLTDVDNHDHEAIIAADEQSGAAANRRASRHRAASHIAGCVHPLT
jgi:hypothetical protein